VTHNPETIQKPTTAPGAEPEGDRGAQPPNEPANEHSPQADPPEEQAAHVVDGAIVHKPKTRKTLWERIESYVERLSSRNAFWHRVCAMIWLPYAFRSGITMKRVDEQTFKATLPFRRFNKNWYNAMAGAALLGNSEIAGGAYVFGACGGDYTVVCKQLEYKFLRPCFGPAEYRITPLDDIHALVEKGAEFNISVRMDIVQVLPELGKPKAPAGADDDAAPTRRTKRDKRVGRCTATFHVTPKSHHKAKKRAHAGER